MVLSSRFESVLSATLLTMCACDGGSTSGGSAGPGCWSCDTQAEAPEGVGPVAATWAETLPGRYVGQMPAGGALESAPFELEITAVAGASTVFGRLTIPTGCEPLPGVELGCGGYTLPLAADMTRSGASFGGKANRVTVFDASAACQPRASDAEPAVNGCPYTQIEYVGRDYGHAMNILIDDTGRVWGSFIEDGDGRPTLWGQRAE